MISVTDVLVIGCVFSKICMSIRYEEHGVREHENTERKEILSLMFSSFETNK